MYLPVITNKSVTFLNPIMRSRDFLHRPLEKRTSPSSSSMFLNVDTPPVQLMPEHKNDSRLTGLSLD